MEERAHWNKIGSSYQEEIFDVFRSDRLKLLPKILQKYYNTSHRAIDFGCGTGRAFEYLSPNFKSVFGVDISDSLLALASRSEFKNITLKQHDLTKPLRASADFGFCCNVVMLPEAEKSMAMLRTIRKSLKPDGTAIFVLPSLDSALYSAWQLIEWYKKENVDADQIPADELSIIKAKKTDLVDGIVYIDGVPTRHYSASQLEVWFTKAGLKITAIDKIEYDWDSEFSSPPKWMKEPYPWDWLVECKLDT